MKNIHHCVIVLILKYIKVQDDFLLLIFEFRLECNSQYLVWKTKTRLGNQRNNRIIKEVKKRYTYTIN